MSLVILTSDWFTFNDIKNSHTKTWKGMYF